MTEDDPLSDLDVRRRQLETHLLHSHDYQEKAAGRLKLVSVLFGIALIFILGEALIYERQPRPASPLVLDSLELTALIVMISVILIFLARRSLHRLNERWLTPEAKKALESLRREQQSLQADGS